MLALYPALVGAPAKAATGDLVGSVTFSQDCGSGLGVGIAFDGTNLWISCHASDPDLLRANPTTGAVDATYSIAGGLGALAYDGGRNGLWAGWGGAGPNGQVRFIQLDAAKNVTGSTDRFVATDAANFTNLDDGLAYDASDDSLYISADASTTIYHYSTAGTLLGSSPWAGQSCYNSGLALGGQLLYQGANGCNHVYVVDKANPSGPVQFEFDTAVAGDPNFRDEDLECDTTTFPVDVMWSKEAYTPNRAAAFEIPQATCAEGGGEGHGRMTGGGSVFTPTGTRVTHGLELHCMPTDGPNNLQVNWGKGNHFHLEVLSSASCSDDPGIGPNPPPAGFDTYRGKGTGRCNGLPATAEWAFADAGEPGKNDTAEVHITGGCTLGVSGNLRSGNHQAHGA